MEKMKERNRERERQNGYKIKKEKGEKQRK